MKKNILIIGLALAWGCTAFSCRSNKVDKDAVENREAVLIGEKGKLEDDLGALSLSKRSLEDKLTNLEQGLSSLKQENEALKMRTKALEDRNEDFEGAVGEIVKIGESALTSEEVSETLEEVDEALGTDQLLPDELK